MNTLKKLGLGIGTLAIATLPFFMRGEPREELVDVLCRDVYESGIPVTHGKIDATRECKLKAYTLQTGDITILEYNDNNWNTKDEFYRRGSTRTDTPEGQDLEDATPQRLGRYNIKGCKIIDDSNVARHSFTPEELQELETIARTNIKYRAMEREVFEDVAKTGTTISTGVHIPIDIPIVRDWLKIRYSLSKRKNYILDKKTIMEVSVDLNSGDGFYQLFLNTQIIKPNPSNVQLGPYSQFQRYDNREDPAIPPTLLEQLVKVVRGEK